ncbi:MAG TPA: hypothetical protein VFF06_29475 [Polyangia bacterium]|nr:hypothetical protein [Polyangia bacterium]
MNAHRQILIGTAIAALAGCGVAPSPGSHRPLIVIAASPQTVKETGIRQWRLHDYRAGDVRGMTLVGLGPTRNVQAATRIFTLPAGSKRAYAVASLYPAVGRVRFSGQQMVEMTLGEAQRAAYTNFKRDFDAFKQAGRVPYDCAGDSVVAAGSCVGGLAACLIGAPTLLGDIAICGAGGAVCAGSIWNAVGSCSPSDPNQQNQNPTDPNQNPSTDPNMMMAGDPSAMDPNAGGSDPNATGGDPNAGGDPNQMAGDPNGTGDPNAGDPNQTAGADPGYDPNGDFGSGTDYGSCSDCGGGFGDGSADA